MKHRLNAIFWMSCWVFSSASAQTTWSIDQLQASAKQNYPMIQQYDLIEKAKEYNVSNASKAHLPQFDITMIGGIIHGFPNAGTTSGPNLIGLIQFSQTLWDGGVTKAQKEIAASNAAIQNAQVNISVYSIQQKVNDLYFGILLIDEQIKQLQLLTETLQVNYKRAESHFNNGTAYKSDVEEIKIELLNVDQQMTELQFGMQAYQRMLSVMTGQNIASDDQFTRPEITTVLSSDVSNRPEMGLFQNQRSLLASQAQLTKSMLYPKLGLMGYGVFIQPGVNFGMSKLNNIMLAGVIMSWNVSGLYKNGNNKKMTDINYSLIQTQEEVFLYGTKLEIEKTQQEIEKYQVMLEKDKELIALKESIKNSYETKYNNGVSTMSQLVTKINEEHLASQKLIVHEIQYLMALYKLKTETGN